MKLIVVSRSEVTLSAVLCEHHKCLCSADEYAIPEPLEYHMGVSIELRRQRLLEVHTSDDGASMLEVSLLPTAYFTR